MSCRKKKRDVRRTYQWIKHFFLINEKNEQGDYVIIKKRRDFDEC